MKSSILATLVLALAVTAGVRAESRSQQKYILKLRTIAGTGTTSDTAEQFEARMTMQAFDKAGKLLATENRSDVREVQYRETRVDAVRLERNYLVARETGQEGEKRLPYAGEKLTFKITPSVKLVSKPVSPAMNADVIRELESSLKQSIEMGKHNICMPNHPIAVGEEWSVPGTAAQTCFNPFQTEGDEAQATGKLVSVEDVRGEKFATVVFHAVLPVSQLGGLEFTGGGTLDETLKTRFPITQQGTVAGEYDYDGTLTGIATADPRTSLKVEVKIRGKSKTTIATK